MNFEPIKQYFKKPKFIELEDKKNKTKGKTKTKKPKMLLLLNLLIQSFGLSTSNE